MVVWNIKESSIHIPWSHKTYSLFGFVVVTLLLLTSMGVIIPYHLKSASENNIFLLQTINKYNGKERGAAGIIKGPYLQNVTANSIYIMWETQGEGDSKVEYGLTSSYDRWVHQIDAKTIHEVNLTGLNSGAIYHYRVSSSGILSDDYTFTTAPHPAETYTFLALGDTRTLHNQHRAVVNSMRQEAADFVINTGDLVESGEEQEQWDTFFNISDGIMHSWVYWPVLGNHEHHGEPYFRYFSLPGNEYWYAFDYGNLRFIALDSTQNWRKGTDQYNWLITELQNASIGRRFIIVAFHHPIYNTGVGHGESNPTGPDDDYYEMRETLAPLFETYGVELVLNGHEHIYEHNLVNDVHYVVTGGGGAPLSLPGFSKEWTVSNARAYHYMRIEMSPFSAKVTAQGIDGSVLDSFVISIPFFDFPPANVTDLNAVDTPNDNGGSITLTWNLSADDGGGWDDVSHYALERATGESGPWSLIDILPAGTLSYIDTTTDGTEYFYRMITKDRNKTNTGPVGGPARSLDNVPPHPPSLLHGYDTPGDDGYSLTLEWVPSADEEHGAGSGDVIRYLIGRGVIPRQSTNITSNEDAYANVTAGVHSYTDTNADMNVFYYYTVYADDGTFLSEPSNTEGPLRSRNDRAPYKPHSLKATNIKGNSVDLTWNAVTDTDLAAYEVFISPDVISADYKKRSNGDFFFFKSTSPENNSCMITGLADDTTYKFKVRALDTVNNTSPFSNMVEVKTPDITPPPAPRMDNLGITITNNPRLTVTGVSIDGMMVTVTINGEERDQIEVDQEDGTFAASLVLDEGFNVISCFAVDASGNIGHLSNTIEITLDTIPPSVSKVTPRDNEASAPLDSYITIFFTEPVSMIGIPQPDTYCKNHNIEFIPSLSGNGSILTLPPGNLLRPGTLYMVSLQNSIRDTAGNQMKEPYSWSFTTTAEPLFSGPEIIHSIPSSPYGTIIGEKVELEIAVYDPDTPNSKLSITWFKNEKVIAEVDKDIMKFVLGTERENPGCSYEIKVDVSDGRSKISHTWIIILFSPESDIDRDGMGDAWETNNGMDWTDPLDGGLDYDGDGISNLEEFLGKSDPLNSLSIPTGEEDEDSSERKASLFSSFLFWLIGIIFFLLILLVTFITYRNRANKNRIKEENDDLGSG